MFHDHDLISVLELSLQRAAIFQLREKRDDILVHAEIALKLNDGKGPRISPISLSEGEKEAAAAIDEHLERDDFGRVIAENCLAGSRIGLLRYSPLVLLANPEPYRHSSHRWVPTNAELALQLREECGIPAAKDKACRKAWSFDLREVHEYLADIRETNPVLFLLLLSDEIDVAEDNFRFITETPDQLSGKDPSRHLFRTAKCSVSTVFRILREVKRAKQIVIELHGLHDNRAPRLKTLEQSSDRDLLAIAPKSAEGRMIGNLANSVLNLGRQFESGQSLAPFLGTGLPAVSDMREILGYSFDELTKNLRAFPAAWVSSYALAGVKRLQGSGGSRSYQDLNRFYGLNITEVVALLFVQTSLCALNGEAPDNALKTLSEAFLDEIQAELDLQGASLSTKVSKEQILKARALNVIHLEPNGSVPRNATFETEQKLSLDASTRRLQILRTAKQVNGAASAAFLRHRGELYKSIGLSGRNAAQIWPHARYFAHLECAVGPWSLDPAYGRLQERAIVLAKGGNQANKHVRKYFGVLSRQNQDNAPHQNAGKRCGRAPFLKNAVTMNELLKELV